MPIGGNVCLLCAALLAWALVSLGLEPDAPTGGGGGGKIIAVALFSLPLWGCLALAYGLAVARGGLDWTALPRWPQHLLAFGGATGVALAIALCAGLHTEPAGEIPWAIRPLQPWGLTALPLLAVGCGVLALNEGLRGPLPPLAWRAPQAATGALALAVVLGLLAEWAWTVQQRDARDSRQAWADAQEFNQQALAAVQAMDTERDFGQLLGYTGRFQPSDVRALALAKLRAHPRFTDELAARLRSEWRGEAMTFIAWNEVPDPAAIAAPAHDAVLLLAADVRRQMREAHYLRDDAFESLAERVLAVANRYGAEFAPAVRAFRAALDEPRPQSITPPCKQALDAWLARQ